jgi:hypothetical protein
VLVRRIRTPLEPLPDGHESDAPVDPQLIVELYSK